jgi:hypothetical protein
MLLNAKLSPASYYLIMLRTMFNYDSPININICIIVVCIVMSCCLDIFIGFSEEHCALICRVQESFTLEMKAVCSSEISVGKHLTDHTAPCSRRQ